MSGREDFVARRRPTWSRLEALLDQARIREAGSWSELASLYREVAADRSRAESLGLPEDVLDYLDRLALRAHNRLYRGGRSLLPDLLRAVLHGFPRTVRAAWPFVLAAHLFFYVPFFIGLIGPLVSPGFGTNVLPESALRQMESMYSGSIERSAADDMAMAGFYVFNNVGIAFRCFATGALGGLGSVFYLVYNGLILGTVEGHLWASGLGWNLTDFTVGHTPWELTGIVMAGAAGLRMGWALVVTSGRTRAGSLRHAGPVLYHLILGATVMLMVAAAIEGFWSSGDAPLPAKIAFGLAGTVVVILWVLLGGRGAAR